MYIHYSIETSWSTLLKSKANYKNYFEPIARGEFYGFNDISKDSIWRAIPFRTVNLNSNGESFYRMLKNGDNIKNNDLENALITLSSGKLSFQDIFNIVKNSRVSALDEDALLNECINIYSLFDKELSIVWKRQI